MINFGLGVLVGWFSLMILRVVLYKTNKIAWDERVKDKTDGKQ